jgi:hypothetical protein
MLVAAIRLFTGPSGASWKRNRLVPFGTGSLGIIA